MLELHQDERQDILQAFQTVTNYLHKQSDKLALQALKELTEGRFKEGLSKADEAVQYDSLLTSIRACLSSEYQKVAAVH